MIASHDEEPGSCQDSAEKVVSAFQAFVPFCTGPDHRVDLATDSVVRVPQSLHDRLQAGVSDHEQVDVTSAGSGAGGDGPENEGELDPSSGLESQGDLVPQTVGLEEDLAQVGEERVLPVGPEIAAVAVSAVEDDLGSDQVSDGQLHRPWGKAGAPDQLAQIELLVGCQEQCREHS